MSLIIFQLIVIAIPSTITAIGGYVAAREKYNKLLSEEIRKTNAQSKALAELGCKLGREWKHGVTDERKRTIKWLQEKATSPSGKTIAEGNTLAARSRAAAFQEVIDYLKSKL